MKKNIEHTGTYVRNICQDGQLTKRSAAAEKRRQVTNRSLIFGVVRFYGVNCMLNMSTRSFMSSGLVRGFVRRGRSAIAQINLTIRRVMTGHPVWIDHKCIKLPFHGDGDLQELHYHLSGTEWWKAESTRLSRYIGEGGVALDVGANLGFVTGILSTLTGSSGHVFSFEPSSSTYAKLLEVIEVNRFANVTPYHLGCGKEEQVRTLYSPRASGHATLRPSDEFKNSARDQQTVHIVKLDDFLNPMLQRLDFIKIDTEGYEDEVLLGALDMLKRFRPVIYIELCAEYRSSSENAVAILRDQGYSFDRELHLEKACNGENFLALPMA